MIALLAASASLFALYAAGAARVRWPLRRGACFTAGLATVIVGGALSERSLALHMLGHALLVSAAAPLLVLGRPLSLGLRALPAESARDLARLLRCRAARALSRPLLAWIMFVALQLAFHLTPLFGAALHDEPLHEAEHLLFLTSALWLWSVGLAVEPLPRRWPPLARAALLLAAMPASDIGAVALMLGGHQAAGAVMAAGMMPFGAAAVSIAWGGLLGEDRRQLRREVAHAAG